MSWSHRDAMKVAHHGLDLKQHPIPVVTHSPFSLEIIIINLGNVWAHHVFMGKQKTYALQSLHFYGLGIIQTFSRPRPIGMFFLLCFWLTNKIYI